MASRLSTPSDGEIVEAKKSHTRSPSSSPINRQSRRVIYSRSPSPTASVSTTRPRRSRSRSPYKDNRDRGYKRRRDDDHYSRRDRDDPRRFRVKYEDRRDERPHRPGERAFEDRRRRSARDRRHSLSRSPPRVQAPRDQGHSRASITKSTQDGIRGFVKAQSGSDWGEPVSDPATTSSAAKPSDQQVPQILEVVSASEEVSVSSPPQPVWDVETLREQKRKKWEAIRAKHRSQPAPLLKQALDASADQSTASSTPITSTPVTPAQAPSVASSAPGTPRSNSSRESTPVAMDFSKDSDLANTQIQRDADVKDDEPSAADYDATMDMEEDKKRHDHRLRDDGTDQAEPPAGPHSHSFTDKSSELKAKNDFDMFADGDEDDDMFAPMSNNKLSDPAGHAGSKAVDVDTIDDWDDDQGYYKVILGELLDSRYHVQSNLGKGMFSAVVRAQDQTTQKLVAIKLIRSNETMRKAAAKEIGILEKLKLADPEDRKHVIRLERSFEHKGHLCMVFENLHENLREVLKKFGRDVGIELQAVRVYAQQIFKGLSLLRKCNILHADLKPDNILVNERRTLLKICDLGSAADASESEITPYLVSRFYRAPEIILGMPFDYAIDTWSIGCTLFELFTGKILFTGRTNNQMLRVIMECRGRFSTKMLRKAEFAGLHFDEQGLFRSVERDRVTGKDVVRTLNFLKPTRDLKARLMGASRDPDLSSFLDLLEKCLTLNPERRINPTDALKHPFLARKL